MRQTYFLAITGLIALTMLSCNGNTNHKRTNETIVRNPDSNGYYGYNELANTDNRETFTISDFNTDNPDVKNIDRPESSRIETSLDTALLNQIWTSDPEGPHADFVFSNHSFFVVDYDGDGDMPYVLNERKLKIYYNDFIQEGEILSLNEDNLKIKWKDIDQPTSYVKWKN